MAAFTAKDVSELRQRTGAGMMECKKALEENEGNIDQSIDWLRKKGIAKAEKRAGRAASEGKVVAATAADGKSGAMVELNSETDFVSRNETFGQTAEKIASTLLADSSSNGISANTDEAPAPLMSASFGDSTLAETLKHMTGTIGENIVLRRYARFEGEGAVGAYVHHNAKIGALVEIAGLGGDAGVQLAKTIAEHVAAGVPTVPLSVNREDVPTELVDRERRIFSEQAAASGKPENIIAKMVDGRIDKYYKEVTLIDQPWIRDDSKSIRDLVKAAGAGVSVKRFARFQMGQE